jgi:hypothetical protein
LRAEGTLERAAILTLLALLPWIMLAVNGDWIYSGSGLIDPWLYHGYFHHYPDYVSTLHPGKYYGTRLAWILPGYAAYHLFPPHAANLVLHLTFYYAATAALYRAATLLTASRAAALISACVFATTTPVIVAFGWDYVDISVITYTAIALWAIVEAGRARRRSLLIAVSGAASACIVHSNLGALLLTPTVAIAYWYTHSARRWSDPLVFGLAAIGITLLFGVCNVLAGGRFFFFIDSVQWLAANIATDTYVPVPPLQWPGSARYLIPLTGVCGAAGAFAARRDAGTRTALLMQVWLMAAFIGYDAVLRGGLLQTQYYVSWFLPLAALGIAVAVSGRGVSTRAALAIAAAIAVLQAGTFGGLARQLRLSVLDRAAVTARAPIEMALAAAALLTIGVMAWRGRRAASAIAIGAAIVLADLVVTPNLNYAPSTSGQSQFDAVQQTLAFIDAYVPAGSKPFFWIPADGPLSGYYTSLASTHLYLGSLVSLTYPRFRDGSKDTPKPGSTLEPGAYVIVTAEARPDKAAVNDELNRYDLSAEIVASTTVRTDQVRFVLTLLHVLR